jgi:hypothetical protein
MQDDIIGALTQEIKEEVIERYLYDRRLVEEQIKYVDELVEQVKQLREDCFSRFVSIYDSLLAPEFVGKFAQALGMENAPFGEQYDQNPGDLGRSCRIKVRGVTPRAKFKRLLSEQYLELYTLNGQYKEAYEDLYHECKAVNYNLKKFQKNYDLLTILNFLRDMDVEFVERKRWLGDNFSPDEMASIEASLSFKLIRMERFKLDPPLILPEPKTISKKLNALADCVYGQCGERVKKLIQ